MAAAGANGLRWNWTASSWAWDPSLGPWRPAHGAPLRLARLDISTADVAQCDAYEFWRKVAFYNFSAHRPNEEQRQRFRADGTGFYAGKTRIGIGRSDRIVG